MDLLRLLPPETQQEIVNSNGNKEMQALLELQCYFGLEDIPESSNYDNKYLADALAVLYQFFKTKNDCNKFVAQISYQYLISRGEDDGNMQNLERHEKYQVFVYENEDLELYQLIYASQQDGQQHNAICIDDDIYTWRLQEIEYQKAAVENEKKQIEAYLAQFKAFSENEVYYLNLRICKMTEDAADMQHILKTTYAELEELRAEHVYALEKCSNLQALSGAFKDVKEYLLVIYQDAQETKLKLYTALGLKEQSEKLAVELRKCNEELETYIRQREAYYIQEKSYWQQHTKQLEAQNADLCARNRQLDNDNKDKPAQINEYVMQMTVDLRLQLKLAEDETYSANYRLIYLQNELESRNLQIYQYYFELGQARYDLSAFQTNSYVDSRQHEYRYSDIGEQLESAKLKATYLENDLRKQHEEHYNELFRIKRKMQEEQARFNEEKAYWTQHIYYFEQQLQNDNAQEEIQMQSTAQTVKKCNEQVNSLRAELQTAKTKYAEELEAQKSKYENKIKEISGYCYQMAGLLAGIAAEKFDAGNDTTPDYIKAFFSGDTLDGKVGRDVQYEFRRQLESNEAESRRLYELYTHLQVNELELAAARQRIAALENDISYRYNAAEQQLNSVIYARNGERTRAEEYYQYMQYCQRALLEIAHDYNELLEICWNAKETDKYVANGFRYRFDKWREFISYLEDDSVHVVPYTQQIALLKRRIDDLRAENARLRKEAELDPAIGVWSAAEQSKCVYRLDRRSEALLETIRQLEDKFSAYEVQLRALREEYSSSARVAYQIRATYEDVVVQRDAKVAEIAQLGRKLAEKDAQAAQLNAYIKALQNSYESAVLEKTTYVQRITALSGNLEGAKRQLISQLSKSRALQTEKELAWREYHATQVKISELQQEIRAYNICQFKREEQNEKLRKCAEQIRNDDNTAQIDMLISSIEETRVAHEDVQAQMQKQQNYHMRAENMQASEMALRLTTASQEDAQAAAESAWQQQNELFSENKRLREQLAQTYAQLVQRPKPQNPARSKCQYDNTIDSAAVAKLYERLKATEHNLQNLEQEKQYLQYQHNYLEQELQAKVAALYNAEKKASDADKEKQRLLDQVKEKEHYLELARHSAQLEINLKHMTDSIIDATDQVIGGGSAEEEVRRLRALLEQKDQLMQSNTLAYENIKLQQRIDELESINEMNYQVDDFTIKLKHEQEVSALKAQIARLRKDVNPLVDGMQQNIQDAHTLLNYYADYTDSLAERIKCAISKIRNDAETKSKSIVESRIITQVAKMYVQNAYICYQFKDSMEDDPIAESFYLYANYFENVHKLLMAPNLVANEVIPKLIREYCDLRKQLVE